MNNFGNIICHIDTANQINNSWYKDTVVGIYAENDSFFSSIIIQSNIKLKIKDKLKEFNEKDIICHLQSYLIYILIKNKEDYFSQRYIHKTFLCPDVRPIRTYIKALSKCFSYHGKSFLLERLKMELKKPNERSKAHPKVRKVYQKKKRNSYKFEKDDMIKFINYFRTISYKKIRKG